MELLETVTVSSAANLDLTAFDDTQFSHYHIIGAFQPASDAVRLNARLSTDGGSTFKSASGDYGSPKSWFSNAGNVWGGAAAADDDRLIPSVITLGNDTGEIHIGVEFILYGMHDLAVGTYMHTRTQGINAIGGIVTTMDAHKRTVRENNNALRFFFASGNIAEGIASLYGIA